MKEPIKVPTDELIAILRENRAKHRAVFDAALAGWRKQAVQWVDGVAAQLSRGRVPLLAFAFQPPEDHTRDYDRVIRMYSMHTEATVAIDETTFASYVQDDWGWKRQFIRSSSSYAAATVQQVYGDSGDEAGDDYYGG